VTWLAFLDHFLLPILSFDWHFNDSLFHEKVTAFHEFGPVTSAGANLDLLSRRRPLALFPRVSGFCSEACGVSG